MNERPRSIEMTKHWGDMIDMLLSGHNSQVVENNDHSRMKH